MGRKKPENFPERFKEASEPEPEATPHAPKDEKGDSTSRVDASQEPSENEEKRRIAKKLEERE